MSKRFKDDSSARDWRKHPSRWPYKGLKDPQYIKDRNSFFRKNGNGWWIFA